MTYIYTQRGTAVIGHLWMRRHRRRALRDDRDPSRRVTFGFTETDCGRAMNRAGAAEMSHNRQVLGLR